MFLCVNQDLTCPFCSERGFKGFGKQSAGNQTEGGRHSSTGSYADAPAYRKASNSSETASVPVSSSAAISKAGPPAGASSKPVDVQYSGKGPTTKPADAAQNATAAKYTASNELMKEQMRQELIRCGEEHFAEKSSDDGSQCTSEDLDESFSDDEVPKIVVLERRLQA